VPADLRDVPRSAGVPRESPRFSGRWAGKWKGQLEHVLVIGLLVRNASTEVTAVSAWAVAPELGVGTPEWMRVGGRIEDGALRLDLTRVSSRAVDTFQADGTLVAEYWRGDRVTSGARLTGVPREGP
jgi:hypothetical protein